PTEAVPGRQAPKRVPVAPWCHRRTPRIPGVGEDEARAPRSALGVPIGSEQRPAPLRAAADRDRGLFVRRPLGPRSLIVAIAPRKQSYKLSFPIHRRDALARNSASGLYRDTDVARRWLSLCCCLPDRCIAPLERIQPYYAAGLFRQSPDHHAL